MRAWYDPPVREAAIVFVNGHRVGALWHPPYRLAVDGFLKQGQNQIVIKVYNTAMNAWAALPPHDYNPLIAKYGEDVTAEGRLGLVDEWLQQLPAKTIHDNARLSLLHGEALGMRGDFDSSLTALDRARTVHEVDAVDERDVQATVVDRVLLQRVRHVGPILRPASRGTLPAAGQDRPDVRLAEHLVHARLVECARAARTVARHHAELDLHELPDFLLGRHLGQQVGHALVEASGCGSAG